MHVQKMQILNTLGNLQQDGHPREVSGISNSLPVRHDGTGTYFLYRTAEGMWRLRVLPNAWATRGSFNGPTCLRYC